jgi:hypothetical protein
MVFFNDPMPGDDHELEAICVALSLQARFRELAETWRRRGGCSFARPVAAYEVGRAAGPELVCARMKQNSLMLVFLETDRLVLRRFTEDDVDNLVELDRDPDVMRFINGGRPTPRREIESDVLPAFLGYYERFAGTASGQPSRNRLGNSSVGFTSDPRKLPGPARSSSATGCEDRRGARVTPPKARGR